MYHYFAEKNHQRVGLSDLSHFAKYRELGADIIEVDDDGNERMLILNQESEESKNE